MKTRERSKSLVIDLNVVEDPAIFPHLVERTRAPGCWLIMTPAHLAELCKDARTWKSSIAKHVSCLRPASDVLVLGQPTERLFIDELQNGRPARKIVSDPATRGLRAALREIRDPKGVDEFFGPRSDAMRDELLRTMLNSERAKDGALSGASFMEAAASRQEWARIRKGDSDLLCALVAEVALEALCLYGELARLDRTAFTTFAGGSVFFKMLAATVLLDFTYRANGLSDAARADNLLNNRLDQYVVIYGAAAGGIATGDGEVQKRHALMPRIVRYAQAICTNDWDRIHANLLSAPDKARAIEGRRRVQAGKPG